MATCKTASRKPTITNVPFIETIVPETAPQPTAFEQYKARAHKAIDDLLVPPEHGWMRTIAAWAITMASSIGLGWLVGYVTTYAIVGAALLSSSVFISLMILLIGLIGSMYISYKTSPIIFKAIIDGTVEKAAVSAWRKTRDFFTPGSTVKAEAA